MESTRHVLARTETTGGPRPRRSVLLAIGLVLAGALLPPAIQAETLLLLSKEHAQLTPLVDALRRCLPRPITELDMSGSDRTRESLVWALRSERHRRIVAVGRAAADLAHRRCPGDRLLVSFPYGDRLSWHERHLVLPTVADLSTSLPLLRTVFPTRKNLSVLFWSPELAPPDTVDRQARDLGFALQPHRIESWRDLRRRVQGATTGCDLLWLPLDAKIGTVPALESILQRALACKIPVLTYSRRIVRGGALACPVLRPDELAAEALRWFASDEATRRAWMPARLALDLHVNENVARYLQIPPEGLRGR